MNESIYPGVDRDASRRGRKSYSLTKQLNAGQSSPDTFSYQTGEIGHGVHVVSFGVSQSVGAGQAAGYSAVATINFLTNGNTVTRQVSIGSGVSVQGTADAISVVVQDTSPSGLGLAPYGVTISVGPGTRASDTQPTLVDAASPRTLAVKGAGGSTVNIPIPQGVGVVGVWLAVGSDTTPDVIFNQTDAASVGRFPCEVKDAIPRYFPIVPGALNLTASNQDAGNTCAVSTMWVIDG
jgi:hypothetical protein